MENSHNNQSNLSENDEHNDPAWDLLKQSRSVEPSAFFSRNVVREVRHLAEAEAAPKGFFAWLRQPIVALAGAAAAIGIAAIIFTGPDQSAQNIAEVQPEEPEINLTAEFADVEYFGDLMAVSDPSTLTDQAFAELF